MAEHPSKTSRPHSMEEREYRIKEFFNTLGFSTALLAGFSFTGIIELSNWVPKGDFKQIREITIAFLVVSFVAFTMPILLNMFFLNVKIDTEKKVKKFRKVRYLYTMIMGAGIGGLEGALCLYIGDNFSGFYEKLLLGMVLGSMVFALCVILWFKTGMDGMGGVHLEDNDAEPSETVASLEGEKKDTPPTGGEPNSTASS